MPGALHWFSRRRLLPAVAVGALYFLTVAAHGQTLPGARVEELLAMARERNPELAAMRAEAAAASERPAAAGALPDPMFRTELQDVTNYGGDRGTSLLPNRVGSTKYTLSQSLPFWGKRALRGEVADAEAAVAANRVEVSWTELATQIKSAHAQYWLNNRAQELNREILDLINRLEQVARIRYANGLAAQQDVIRAQVERSTMKAELIALEAERMQLRALINSLLTRPADAALADPELLRSMPPTAALDPVLLAERIEAKNPQLAAEQARFLVAEKNRELTYRNRYPDFTLGVSPIQERNQVNMWEIMLELNIPLQQGARRAQEREAEGMVEAARARRMSLAYRLRGEVSNTVAALEAARQVEMLTRSSLLPQADLTLQAAMVGYETGKVDFATLLDAQRQIRTAKLDVIKAQAEQQLRLAELERLVGEDL